MNEIEKHLEALEDVDMATLKRFYEEVKSEYRKIDMRMSLLCDLIRRRAEQQGEQLPRGF